MSADAMKRDAMKQDDANDSSGTALNTDRPRAEQAQPDPKKMQRAPLRSPTSASDSDAADAGARGTGTHNEKPSERGSPNVHMEPGHDDDPAATDGERPKFDFSR